MSVNKTISLDEVSERIWFKFYKEMNGDFSNDIQNFLKDKHRRMFESESVLKDIEESESKIEQEKKNIEFKKERLKEIGEQEFQKIKAVEEKAANEEEKHRLWLVEVYKKHLPLRFENISEEQIQQFAEEYVSIPTKERPNWLKYFQEVKGLKLKEEMKGGSSHDVNV